MKQRSWCSSAVFLSVCCSVHCHMALLLLLLPQHSTALQCRPDKSKRNVFSYFTQLLYYRFLREFCSCSLCIKLYKTVLVLLFLVVWQGHTRHLSAAIWEKWMSYKVFNSVMLSSQKNVSFHPVPLLKRRLNLVSKSGILPTKGRSSESFFLSSAAAFNSGLLNIL